MPYQFLEDVGVSDIAFDACGRTVGEALQQAAEATMNVMVDDIEAIAPQVERSITLENEELDLLMHDLLQELIYFKDAHCLLLRVVEVRVDNHDGRFRLQATARGEELDVERHHLRVDVKAVTLHQLTLEKTSDGWRARAILDV